VYDRGNYVKDLSKLGRDLTRVVIVDNSPASYLYQPENAIPVSSWFDDRNDTLLKDIITDMEQVAYSSSSDFYTTVKGVQNRIHSLCENYQ
jgi:RNA polymerase II subunit A small phosphatase-like protein